MPHTPFRQRPPSSFLALLLACLCQACLAGQNLWAVDGAAGDVGDGDADGDGDVEADADADRGGVGEPCLPAPPFCLDHATRRSCEGSAGELRWGDEACGPGAGCVRGECVPGRCSDACTLGATDGGRTCELYDVTTGGFVAPDPDRSLHDRARAFTMWLRRDGMSNGGVGGNVRYADPPAYTEVVALGHMRDSAIWTGTYLAAEALRLRETGSADARRAVEGLVETLHDWFAVTGQPGLLSRFAAPAGEHPLVPFDCSNPEDHCGVEHGGELWDWRGHVSRDQYQGVMLGYALAYEALGELGEAHRALIREDVVALVRELMTERDLPVRITINGYGLPVFDVRMRFAVVAPLEMDDGAARLVVDTDDYDDAEMTGFQEFMPDLGPVVRQIPGFSWVPAIPRASSAIMLASFFRVAMLVTGGVPGFEADHAAFVDFYLHNAGEGGNVEDWLSVARTWSYAGACGEAYFGINISMEPLYNWARLEDDATLGDAVRSGVLAERLWPAVRNTKNSFFSFIYAANAAAGDPSVVTTAREQLAQIGPPPRVRTTRDLRTDPRYPLREDGCGDQVDHGTAVDVADRCEADFVWQSHPWSLVCEGDPSTAFSGVDFLVAYWLGRFHGFVEDDAPGRCLAWR